MTIMDIAVYDDGRRRTEPVELAQAHEVARSGGGLAWVDLAWPSTEEIEDVAKEFGVHALAVEDSVRAHQRPKTELYDESMFVVLHPARTVDDDGDGLVDRIEFGEVHAWIGPDYAITIRRSKVPRVETLQAALDADLLRSGPGAVLFSLFDAVVDTYRPVVARLRRVVDDVEDDLFSRDPQVSRRIYEATREVIALQRAIHPVVDMLRPMAKDAGKPVELRQNFRNVLDHAIRYADAADHLRLLLANALNAHSTLVAQEQNDEMRRLSEVGVQQAEAAKKISSWAAILFAPTMVASIYGMNFDHMPELHWTFGYPLALLIMLGAGIGFWRIFKKVGWL
ncbi:magnesium and cobalt transport protein CorA [Myceligenerans crystallogenes]|uniref:Magnesium/cobalt transporter CorA n=1 Tax=Myceligenerans crystallogenes TaxID=316335 RepID=A0ABP4ZPH9_9MICO